MAKGTVNKVTLIGRLGQDPEIRFSGDGKAIATFSVATNESWKNKDGEVQERLIGVQTEAILKSKIEHYS